MIEMIESLWLEKSITIDKNQMHAKGSHPDTLSWSEMEQNCIFPRATANVGDRMEACPATSEIFQKCWLYLNK